MDDEQDKIVAAKARKRKARRRTRGPYRKAWKAGVSA
jgi:hypothetical protein